ncbi:MAG TPA: 3-hydroxyacyl-CoA dehydrogenase family protein [Solirubrobacteraceae bacterium]
MNVAVLGGGIMGNGIAQIAAGVGDDAVVRDVDDAALERARAAIETSLGRFVKKERLTADEADAVLGRIRFTTDMEEALKSADVVIEAVPEVLDLKRSVWQTVGELAPGQALLGTNTSQLSITSIAVALGEQAPRLVGTHFFNPPVMMRLCEVIAGTETRPEEVQRACEFGRHLGKEVVVCRKDSPGFITSRAYAILRLECIRMLEEGVASAEDIDTALKLGFNFPMGPLELGDMNGLDTFLHAVTGLADAHGDRFRPTVGLRNMVAANRLGRKTGAGFYNYDGDGRKV